MHIVTLHSVWILLVAMTGFDVQGAGPPITCEAGTFTVGEPASITCNFRVPITSTERPINMARYPSDAPRGAIGTDVLLCRWAAEKRKHDCFTEMANYTFDGILTDHLTVEIPAVNFEQAGLYMCFFVPSEGTDPHPCELRVQAKPQHTSIKGESQDVLPIILSGIVLFVIVLSAGVLILLRKRRFRNKKIGHPTKAYEPLESTPPQIHKADRMIQPSDEKRSAPTQTSVSEDLPVASEETLVKQRALATSPSITSVRGDNLRPDAFADPRQQATSMGWATFNPAAFNGSDPVSRNEGSESLQNVAMELRAEDTANDSRTSVFIGCHFYGSSYNIKKVGEMNTGNTNNTYNKASAEARSALRGTGRSSQQQNDTPVVELPSNMSMEHLQIPRLEMSPQAEDDESTYPLVVPEDDSEQDINA